MEKVFTNWWGLKPGIRELFLTPALRLGLGKAKHLCWALALVRLLILCGPLFLTGIIYAQDKKPAFWDDIQKFKKQDSVKFPGTNKILLVGSSSFTKWTDVQTYFPAYPIVNRGFGGSTLLDQIRYVKDVVYPYKPKQIIIYCGENDLASSDTLTSKMVYNRFLQFFNLIRTKFPNVSVAFISLKPSPSRQLLMGKMREVNDMVRKFLKTKKQTAFIDVYKDMIDDEGKPMPDIFLDDNLHMNSKGYAIWKKAMEPYLKK